MLKWIAGTVLVVVVLAGALALGGPSLILRFPALIGIISRITDPIGPYAEVEWEEGPSVPAEAPSARPPNIVFVLVDDLGWNDLTWNGGGVADGSVPTPNIDSLASDGVQFTMGYAGNATCAPSRAALLTGRYPPRFGFESTPAPAALGKMVAEMSEPARQPGEASALFYEDSLPKVPPMEEQGMPGSEITVAELLRESGYRTLMLGKWHLGEEPGQRPTDQGFDEFLGFYSGGSLYGAEDDPEIVSARQAFDPIDVFLWSVLPFAVRKDTGPRFAPDDYMTDYLSNEAVKAINANRNRPFFLYLAYNAPHTPLQAALRDYEALDHIDHHPTRVYAAMLRGLDRGVGRVLVALRANGLDDNTLVVLSSDNGGAHYVGIPDLNAPYRGWKMTFFEGGLHSPFFLKWPARLSAGTSVEAPVSHIDLFATAASAAGVAVPGDRKIDGVDLLPFATGQRSGPVHEALYWRSGVLSAVQSDGWKLQVDGRQERRWLFDLAADPTEQVDQSEQEPEILRSLEARLEAHNQDLGPRSFPVLVEGVIPIDRTLADPYVPGETFAYWPN
ncbi:MAG: sulfatase-like hydrolase/transferase [Myxococcota bacterium]|nr:sulfatase-like hydrolase/transferase [Myxococcota bacterium]